jgi:GDP-L-fucose synthase
MNRSATILITGASGMVGSALVRRLAAQGYRRLLTPSRSALDLRDAAAVDRYFSVERPEYVFMIAAKVGGIAANAADPVGFMNDNLTMTLSLFGAAHRHGVRKSLFLGSSCIYPKACPQPMREEHLLTGPLEPTNEAYAIAKIAGLKLADYYFRQYGVVTVCPMPCNIYGTNDHFDLEKAHVLSALVRRFVDAVDDDAEEVTLWGTGAARREFIHVEDVVTAMLLLMDRCQTPEIVNVGTGVDVSIADLAALVAGEAGYRGRILWDRSKPDGMPRKCLDVSRIARLGFVPAIDLQEGIRMTVREYRALRPAGETAA